MYNPPPADLNSREPLIYVASDAETWYRSHQTRYEPIFFGKGMSHRWDAPNGEYGVLYLGRDPYCAFMESIGRGVLKTRFIPKADLQRRGLAEIAFEDPLILIDMVASGGLTRLGAEGSLTGGAGYRNSQRWSKALRDHPKRPHGLYYYSRNDVSRIACALYDHCEPLVKIVAPCKPWADQPVLLGAILDHYGFSTDL